MKNKKWLKVIILASLGIIFILTGLLSWNLYFSKYKIFYSQEEMFLEAVERFYSMNKKHLPKKNETREMTLQDLYDGDHINDLYIPKTRKLCDSNSWVRVYHNEKGEYEYTTYLKCGKYESSVDHTGPVITLNGNDVITIAVGSTYQELGVKKIVDDKDGKISISDVVIDNNIDTSKVGSYLVNYTVRDKAYNKTVVTRRVNVAYNLTEVVKKVTDDSNYYRGNNVNNYILFSGMLFRIVNVNSDGSVKLISNDSIANLRMNHDTYIGSNVDTWLKEYYYPNLNNSDKYLVDSTYCVGNINSMSDYSTSCSETITSKVGLLSVDEYYKTLDNNHTYLTNDGYFALANKSANRFYKIPTIFNENGNDALNLAPIRPVITLKSNLYMISGDGSYDNPYKLDDYYYANTSDKINTRLVGEYIEYSGMNFRIIGIDSNNDVRLIMAQPWVVQPDNNILEVSLEGIDNYVFNVKEQGNPGYVMNNDYLDYIDTTYIVDTSYEIPTNNSSVKYNEYEEEKIKAKVLLPKTYELFSSFSREKVNNSPNYLYIDKSLTSNYIFTLQTTLDRYGLVLEEAKNNTYDYPIKAVITLKGDLKIASGKGTIISPYRLK